MAGPSARCFRLAVLLAIAMPATAFGQSPLTVDGTQFVLSIAGRTLRSADLVGATLDIASGGRKVAVSIQSVEDDPHAIGGHVMLHHFVVTGDAGQRADLCAPDAQGKSLGFPVPDGRGGFDLACTSGAIGKCIRWGYRPWEEQADGPPLRALHQACTHMTRADYGGDGGTNTRDGTLIYFCDRFGVRACAKDAPLSFEAAWGTNGAICVARPRIAEISSLDELAARYPKLASRLGAACTEADAMVDDPAALLFSWSGR